MVASFGLNLRSGRWTAPEGAARWLFALIPLPGPQVAELAPPAFVQVVMSEDGQSGHGWYTPSREPCLTEAERERIRGVIDGNRRTLRAAGLLPIQDSLRVLFDWPLRAVGSAGTAYGVHGISNFVDLDPNFPDQLLDYNCGDRSYDRSSGYNHRGIDIFTWPLPWTWMDADEVEIVAAAGGTIVSRSDGNFDESCGFGGGNWNAVYIDHGDGSVAWYGHMKSGSITPKVVGQRVARGEYLGVVGSSGNSTGPHLHFEVYDKTGSLVEPFTGPCNNLNDESWWRDQPPYYDSAINRLMVGDAPVEFMACPGRTVTHEAAIDAGSTGYFSSFYRDQLDTQVSEYRIRRPDGSLFTSWTHSSPAPHYAASWWWFSRTLPSAGPLGTWSFEVSYEGEIYTQSFTVQ